MNHRALRKLDLDLVGEEKLKCLPMSGEMAVN